MFFKEINPQVKCSYLLCAMKTKITHKQYTSMKRISLSVANNVICVSCNDHATFTIENINLCDRVIIVDKFNR